MRPISFCLFVFLKMDFEFDDALLRMECSLHSKSIQKREEVWAGILIKRKINKTKIKPE